MYLLTTFLRFIVCVLSILGVPNSIILPEVSLLADAYSISLILYGTVHYVL